MELSSLKARNELTGLSLPAPYLGAQLPLAVASLLIPIAAIGIIWFGAANPSLINLFNQPWPSAWGPWLAGALALTLLGVPIFWMLLQRKMDLLGMYLMQSGLLISGYFFLDDTALRLFWSGPGALATAPLVVTINAVGFSVLLTTLGMTYFMAWSRKARLRPLVADPKLYDKRLVVLLRFTGICSALVIALPMAVARTIPMLAADPTEARLALVQSDTARALYHVGTAILPFIVGGLASMILRRPSRIFGIDGAIAGGIVMLQILTSNRLPIAISLLVTATLLTMDRKWPRWMIALACAGYLFMFTGMSGFTSLLRTQKTSTGGDNIVLASLKEAFLGDNLIDLRDASWVFSHWNREPLMGKTYLGGLVAMMPSGIFPQKKEWHLGITGIRIVGWDPDLHFGLRITFFGESFLNFGWAGVVTLGAFMGVLFGTLLRMLHIAGSKTPSCLSKNLVLVLVCEMCQPIANTSDAFTSWAILAFLAGYYIWVEIPVRLIARETARLQHPPQTAGPLLTH